MQKYAYDVCLRGGGNLKASLTRVSSFVAFTMAGGGQAAPIFGLMARRIAFTMAEILLSLTIIGVVAAITLPSLTGNINERTWNTQRKALYSRLSQAVALMPSVRGYGDFTKTTEEYESGGYTGTHDVISSENATETFITSGLGKVLKLNNVCNHENMGDCGFPSQIVAQGGSKVALSNYENIQGLNDNFYYGIYTGVHALGAAVDTYGAVFETANGESVLVHYNPLCRDKATAMVSNYFEPLSALCANFIYDLNGKKGPNTVGKDIGFMSLFFPSDSELVHPFVHNKISTSTSVTHASATLTCRNLDDSRLPTLNELSSIMVNKTLFGYTADANWEDSLWSATTYEKNANSAWFYSSSDDQMRPTTKTRSDAGALCVYRN